MNSVQSIFPENPVQLVSSSSVSKPNNSFQKLMQTKNNNAEDDFQDSLDGRADEFLSDVAPVDDLEERESSLQAENLIPMAFIPVLEQIQSNDFVSKEQPEIVASFNADALSEELFASSDRMTDFSLLSVAPDKASNLPEENAASKPFVAVELQETVLETKTVGVVEVSKKMMVKQAETADDYVSASNELEKNIDFIQNKVSSADFQLKGEENFVALAESADDYVNTSTESEKNIAFAKNKFQLKGDENSVALVESADDYVSASTESEKNLASAKNKLSAPQSEKAIAQSADKTTESKSFWENVSSRLTVRKEISEQPSGNMSSQQSLTEANLPDTALNGKDISSVNERLNQLFDFTDSDNVLDQVVKKVEIDLKQGQTEMRMQLKPENLGEVQMKVVVEDGKLNAHFLTSTATAKEALEANVQQLKQSLQEQGVRVEKIAVLLSSGDLQFNQKQQDENLYQNQKISKNWRKSGIADYESADEAVVSRVNDSNQILSAEQVDYRA